MSNTRKLLEQNVQEKGYKFKFPGHVKSEFLQFGSGTRNVNICVEYLPVEIC